MSQGDLALCHAVEQGHEKVVGILAEAGVDVDREPGNPDMPPILRAMQYGQEKMVQLLLKLGAQWVDPLKSIWADDFPDSIYPIPPSPKPLLKV